MRKLPVGLPLILLAACVAPKPVPAPIAAPVPPPPSPAPVAKDWRDLPAAAGSWAYVADGAGSSAMFGRAGAEADFILRCDLASRSIIVSRPGAAVAGGTITFTASAGNRSYPAVATGGGTQRVGAVTPASDAFLDWIAFSRGRFVVTATGLPLLVLPAWPEPARVIEDCRKPGSQLNSASR